MYLYLIDAHFGPLPTLEILVKIWWRFINEIRKKKKRWVMIHFERYYKLRDYGRTGRTLGKSSWAETDRVCSLQSDEMNWAFSSIEILLIKCNKTCSNSSPSLQPWISALTSKGSLHIKSHTGKFFLGIIKSLSLSLKLGQ